eukprot:g57429.t1
MRTDRMSAPRRRDRFASAGASIAAPAPAASLSAPLHSHGSYVCDVCGADFNTPEVLDTHKGMCAGIYGMGWHPKHHLK